MAENKRAPFVTSVDGLPTNAKPDVPEVVQGGVLSKPWQDFLDLITPLPPRTRLEVFTGKMALLRHKLEEEQEGYRNMLDWGTFDREVQGMAASADVAALFKLQEFIEMNETLTKAMTKWQIKNIKAAVVREGDHAKVKAVTPHGEVLFEEPLEGFPGEDLMTKLQLINPPDRQK